MIEEMGNEQSAEAPAEEAPTSPDAAAPEKPQGLMGLAMLGSANSTPPSPEPLSYADIENLEPETLIKMINDLVASGKPADALAACCSRVRVLCRDPATRFKCEELFAAAAVIKAMNAAPSEPNVQVEGLAALVNFSAGEDDHPRRQAACDADALPCVVGAMKAHLETQDVQHMACIALQNLVWGDTAFAVQRRQAAWQAGAIQAVVAAMTKHQALQGAKEMGMVTLRMMLEKLPAEAKEEAVAAGAPGDLIEKPKGSFGTFRKPWGTFGTARAKTSPGPAGTPGGHIEQQI